MHRQIRGLILVAALGTLAACAQKTSSPSAEATTPRDTAKAFQVDAQLEGDRLELTIAAKQGFKINAEYPHTFRPAKEGVKFASDRIELWESASKTACAGKPDDTCSMTASIPFEGEGKAEGIAAFSVCDAELCLIEKVPVSLVVAAK